MKKTENLKKLRESLPKDYAALIESKTKLSQSTIYKVMAGQRKNAAIINAAIEIANEQKFMLAARACRGSP